MPELPEVETVRRGLEPVLVGQRFVSVEQRREALRFPFGTDFAERLEGKCVRTLSRRAKYLRAGLSSGESLVMHLGMSGRFLISEKKSPNSETLGDYIYETHADTKHDHVVFRMSGGRTVTYNDPRRFGFMLVIDDREFDAHALFRHLGVEPLSNQLSALHLAEKACGRRSNLKSFLMDQRIIAGLGNIYVCEALHHAQLSPNRGASCLADRFGKPTVRAERLVHAIRHVLTAAVKVGGSTLRDHRAPNGDSGQFQEAFAVYGRAGAPCPRSGCRGTVKRLSQSGRSTFYCGGCQR